MEEMLSLAATAAGWAGALGTAAAYGLVSRRVVEPDSATFQSLNLSGAALLGVSAAANGAWPAVAANFVWVLISVQAMISARGVVGAVRARLRRSRDPVAGRRPTVLVSPEACP
ncbi:CBU_0592 family membrane protein [Amycolatopsis sp. NPDC004378]